MSNISSEKYIYCPLNNYEYASIIYENKEIYNLEEATNELNRLLAVNQELVKRVAQMSLLLGEITGLED